MKTFNITIKSKNKTSINEFFLFFRKTKLYNLNIIKKYFQKKMEKKKLTILKSPHVNKKAQEQFENRLFKKQIKIQTTENLKYLIFLKKLNSKLFPDIKIKLTYKTNNKKKFKKLGLKIFNPNNFKINKYYNFKTQNLNQVKKKNKNISKHLLTTKTNRLLKIFDLYGELFKHMFE
jgi:ribosomal protein S10